MKTSISLALAAAAACDALVLPSRFEGCPNFMLEAMAMGKPVFAADIAPITEIVRAHDAAMLFRLGDVADLASRVSTLLAEPFYASAGFCRVAAGKAEMAPGIELPVVQMERSLP